MKKTRVDKSLINGKGLYITESAKKEEIIDYIHGDVHVFKKITPFISKKMLNWIGVGRHSWIDTSKSKFRFINHSCDPNVAIVTKRKVIAIKNLTPGTELLMDYSLTEAEDGWSITCNCNTKNCRKVIGPIQTIPKQVFQKYKKYIPKNFIRIYNLENKKQ